ncbi:uncharacterized protein LOC144783417 [Lissotriton helveticus]
MDGCRRASIWCASSTPVMRVRYAVVLQLALSYWYAFKISLIGGKKLRTNIYHIIKTTTKETEVKMMSIEEIMNINTDDNKPYQKPIRVNVINCSGKTTYKNAKQEQKILFHLALADKTGTIKCTCYQENLYEQTKNNCGLLIRNFIIKNKTILITKQTKVTKFPAMAIEDGLIQQANNILHPPAPSASPIKEIKRASLKSLMTVSGTIIAVSNSPTRGKDGHSNLWC